MTFNIIDMLIEYLNGRIELWQVKLKSIDEWENKVEYEYHTGVILGFQLVKDKLLELKKQKRG